MSETARCLGVQTWSYQEIIAAGDIWSLSDVQVSPIMA